MERLLTLKEFCEALTSDRQLAEFLLNEIEWKDVEQLIATLAPFNKYSKKLQSESVTLSDFFGFWTSLRIKMSKKNDELSISLLDQMNVYQERLINNPVIAAAVYLDPRYQRALKNDREVAVNFLITLYNKIIAVESFETNQIESIDRADEDGDENDSIHELEDYLNACRRITPEFMNNENQQPQSDRIGEILADFNGIEESLKCSVLEYWKQQKTSRPELYKLASAINGIPPTQCTVERAFSSLAIILTSHRTNLGNECLQNILLVRLNNEIYLESQKNKNTIELVNVIFGE